MVLSQASLRSVACVGVWRANRRYLSKTFGQRYVGECKGLRTSQQQLLQATEKSKRGPHLIFTACKPFARPDIVGSSRSVFRHTLHCFTRQVTRIPPRAGLSLACGGTLKTPLPLASIKDGRTSRLWPKTDFSLACAYDEAQSTGHTDNFEGPSAFPQRKQNKIVPIIVRYNARGPTSAASKDLGCSFTPAPVRAPVCNATDALVLLCQ